MRGVLTILMLVATIGLLAPAAWAQSPPAPAATPEATPATPADAAPAATVTPAPASRKYGVAPGILLGVGILLAGGGGTAVALDEETLGYTGVCLGGALALTGLALLIDRGTEPPPVPAPVPPPAAEGEPEPIRGVVAPVVGPEFVGLAGVLQF